MPTTKPLVLYNGSPSEVLPNTTSAGAADAGKLIVLDSTGHIDLTVLPPTVGPDVQLMPASEALSAGALVNVWNNGGVSNARNADGSVRGKSAKGFVLAAVSSGGGATVYFPGNLNSSLTGLTPGAEYYLSTSSPGGVQTSYPSTSGGVSQLVGVAMTPTTLAMQSYPAYGLA